MTRYLSEVSGYYGCQWRQDNREGIEQKKDYSTMSQLLRQRDAHCRRLRLHSLFEDMPTNEHIEDYSPSAVRRQRAKSIPPLQDIYEDVIFHPSSWASPTLTRKQRREILNQRTHHTQNNINDNKRQRNMESNNNEYITNSCATLRITEKFTDSKYTSPQMKRRNYGKHSLSPLQEEKMIQSFEEAISEEENEYTDVVIRRTQNENRRKFRPRSWSE